MVKLETGWNICVVSGFIESTIQSALSNALLYGEKVIWLPTALPLLILMDYQLKLNQEIPILRENIGEEAYAAEKTRRELRQHRNFLEDISSANLPILVPQWWQATSLLSDLKVIQEEGLKEYESTLQESPEIQKQPREVREILRRHAEVQVQLNILQRLQKSYAPAARALSGGENPEVVELMQKTRACIVAPGCPYTIETPAHWSADASAERLMNTLSMVLLPDVSSLPLPEVAELREEVKDELTPMRGEMLRLTEDLRKMVKEECSTEELAREAENIIKTRVESVIFEADKYISEQLNKRWKKFLSGTLGTIGLAGVGFLSPDFFKHATKVGIETAAKAISDSGQPRAPTATAQFVLEIRRHYAARYNY